MHCGLFGKLVAKRDFIAVNMPKELMLPWEAWMQGGLSASKNELAGAWLKSYLEAPLWRFWLGPGVCGLAVKGVFMSSMDGVGRHFPLSVFSCAAAGQAFPAPSEAEDQAWFDAAEDFLLSTIDAGDDYDAVLAGLAGLADADSVPAEAEPASIASRHRALIASAGEERDLAGAFAALDEEHRRRDRIARSYWWTIGGADHPAVAIAANGLPEPHIMSLMLTGASVPAAA